jgi:hypothetical protein
MKLMTVTAQQKFQQDYQNYLNDIERLLSKFSQQLDADSARTSGADSSMIDAVQLQSTSNIASGASLAVDAADSASVKTGSLPSASNPGALVVQLAAQPASAVSEQQHKSSLETTSPAQTVEQTGSVLEPLPFGEPDSIDQFEETYDEFDARLCRSNLFPRPVPGNGACFWLACLRGMQWLAKRNNTWAKATKVPATAMEMRQKVLDFMETNLKTNWYEKGLSSMTDFETAILAELPYGVLCGASGETLRPTCIPSWFEVMRKKFSYTSLCCVQATSLCFDLNLKIFIQGSNAVEQYVTQNCLIQSQEMTANVNPDVCVCLCKRNRGGHFDPCEWVAPKVHAHNSATKAAKRKRT